MRCGLFATLVCVSLLPVSVQLLTTILYSALAPSVLTVTLTSVLIIIIDVFSSLAKLLLWLTVNFGNHNIIIIKIVIMIIIITKLIIITIITITAIIIIILVTIIIVIILKVTTKI